MSSNFLKFTVATAVSALLSGAAFADNGFYVTGGFNSTTLQHNLSRGPNAGAVPDSVVGVSALFNGPTTSSVDQDTGASFYISGGYRLEVLDGSFIEVEAFYADETAETSNFSAVDSISLPTSTTLNKILSTDVELSNSYGIDVHLGQEVTEKLSVYGLVGITQFEGDVTQSLSAVVGPTTFSFEEVGFVYGAGVEVKLTSNIATFGEVRITNDLEFDAPDLRLGVSAANELDFTGIRTGLKYKF